MELLSPWRVIKHLGSSERSRGQMASLKEVSFELRRVWGEPSKRSDSQCKGPEVRMRLVEFKEQEGRRLDGERPMCADKAGVGGQLLRICIRSLAPGSLGLDAAQGPTELTGVALLPFSGSHLPPPLFPPL